MAGLSDFVSLSITIIFCIMLSAITVILSKAKDLRLRFELSGLLSNGNFFPAHICEEYFLKEKEAHPVQMH
jgi:hypothetical protein